MIVRAASQSAFARIVQSSSVRLKFGPADQLSQACDEIGRVQERMVAMDLPVRRVERVDLVAFLGSDVAHPRHAFAGEQQLVRIEIARLGESLRLAGAAPDDVLVEIVDEVYLPLVRGRRAPPRARAGG